MTKEDSPKLEVHKIFQWLGFKPLIYIEVSLVSDPIVSVCQFIDSKRVSVGPDEVLKVFTLVLKILVVDGHFGVYQQHGKDNGGEEEV